MTQYGAGEECARAVRVDYYDGLTARALPARLTQIESTISLQFDGGASKHYSPSEFSVRSQLAGAPRRIEFSDGALAICNDAEGINAMFGDAVGTTLAHRLEANLVVVLASMVGIVVALVFAYLHAIPWMAREVAERLPARIEQQLGQVALNSLDQVLFGPSGLEAAAQAPIRESFAALSRAAALPAVVLEFRDGGRIGANALALPGGIVVVTDQLITAMPSNSEVTAVLAHELGHVAKRHSLRHAFQGSALAVITFTLFGDITAISTAAALSPAALAQAGYSREFEREADDYAFGMLRKIGLSPRSFATALDALQRAHRQHGKAGAEAKKGRSSSEDRAASRKPSGPREFSDYLSTHPAIEERARAAERAAQ